MKDKLIELRERTRGLESVKCRIAHERVLIDGNSGVPVSKFVSEPVYERVGLCPPDVRARRISCGHTMARYVLADALALLESEGGGKIRALADELDEITNAIHLLDHRKGDSEKELAKAIEQVRLTPNDEEAAETVDDAAGRVRLLEEEHNGYVDRIAAVRDKIIKAFDIAIERNAG